MTYSEAAALFDKKGDTSSSIKVSRDTLIERRGNAFVVNVDGVEMVKIRHNNTYRVNSGRRKTRVTKNRLNDILPCTIKQTSGVWHIGDKLYQDGMIIDSKGKPANPASYPLSHAMMRARHIDGISSNFVCMTRRFLEMGNDRLGAWENNGTPFGQDPPDITNVNHIQHLLDLMNRTYGPMHNLDRRLRIIRWSVMEKYKRLTDRRDLWLTARTDVNYQGHLETHSGLLLRCVSNFISKRKPNLIEISLG